MKTFVYVIIAVLVLSTAVFVALETSRNGHVPEGVPPPPSGAEQSLADPKNAAYVIDGKNVTLKNGRAETAAAPGSASKLITAYFGNEAKGDLNGDGMEDIAFILTQQTGGSGTFFYAVAALKTADGYTGTNAVLLGDRIAPQTTEVRGGVVIVNYADRKRGEPMTAAPSVGVSKYMSVQKGALVEEPIIVDTPAVWEGVSSPMTITGRARGNWYFEASFPLVLTNESGIIIAQGHAEAQSDWMTPEFVPFVAKIEFTAPKAGTHGRLIVKKDNPSGLPEHDDSREIPVVFK